jgi:hypothetical protein
MKPAKRKASSHRSTAVSMVMWPLLLLLFVLFCQVLYWLFPCNSGLFIGGCGLAIMVLYVIALYGILLYGLFLGGFLLFRFGGKHVIFLSTRESICIGVFSAICGVVFLYVFPFYDMLKGLFEIVFTAADKGYIPSFFFEAGKAGIRI